MVYICRIERYSDVIFSVNSNYIVIVIGVYKYVVNYSVCSVI